MERILAEHPPIVAIVGPTAAGKSRLALQLADRFRADIVTADSRQVYRYMDICTAKPSKAEQTLVAHYMIDLVQPSEPYSVERYRTEGSRVLERIGKQGRMALVAGGTGFYVRALLEGLYLPAVPPDLELRNRARVRVTSEGVQALHRDLARLDPVSAARIHPNNTQRVIRALEIVEYLGTPVPQRTDEKALPALYLGLTHDRPVLHDMANRRVLDQMEMGLVDETRLLLEMGYDPESPAMQGFGYRQMVAYLQGRLTLEEATVEYQSATRRYIRRQLTWFRQVPGIRWITGGSHALEGACEVIEPWLTSLS